MTAAGADHPIWKYLDKILFGAIALLLTLAISRLNAIGDKVDEAVSKLATVSERVDGTRDRVARLEQVMYQPREDRNGK